MVLNIEARTRRSRQRGAEHGMELRYFYSHINDERKNATKYTASFKSTISIVTKPKTYPMLKINNTREMNVMQHYLINNVIDFKTYNLKFGIKIVE